MPFIPHTEEDVKSMLATLGMQNTEELFVEVPKTLRGVDLSPLPEGISEMALSRLMQERAQNINNLSCYIGAGAYEHHIPGAVWDLATRGEFMTAYTPYQAEASQGSLQLIYEYQTMMASLMGMDVSNASLYEGASALAEALLMSLRLLNPKNLGGETPTILMPLSVHPHYREVVQTIVAPHQVRIVEVPFDAKSGRLTIAVLEAAAPKAQVLVLPQPNFFGVLEEVDPVSNWAKAKNMLVVGLVNPMAMALLKPPGQWGERGADIACGEGQPLGIPLSCGGPYYGFITCKMDYVRQMPGRIVGRTQDQDGKEGFVLTLQAREQHIRRAKATSNICTNQGLMVTASTIYMSLLGPQGLRKVALASHQRAVELYELLLKVPGVKPVFDAPFFHEFAFTTPKNASPLLTAIAKLHVQAGYELEKAYPALKNALLVCATETKTTEDLKHYSKLLKEQLSC